MARVMPSQVVQTIDECTQRKTNLATCSLVARYYKAHQRLFGGLCGFDTCGKRHR